MKKLLTIWFAAAVLAVLIPTIGFAQPSDRPGVGVMVSVSQRPAQSERVFFYNRSGDERTTIALKDSLVERGAWHVNAFLPDFIGCELPPDVEVGDLLRDNNFSSLPERSIGMSGAAAAMPGLDLIRESYALAQRLWSSPSPDGASPADNWRDGFDDIVVQTPPEELQMSPEMIEALEADDDTRLVNQNSEFLVGNVLVISIYPESDGGTEDWSDNELADATMGVYSAMLNFQEQFDFVPMNFTFKTFRRSATGYEPISYEMQTDYLWINDVMLHLGYTPGHSQARTAVHAFNEDWRRYYGGTIDWVYTAFIANSQNVANHRFDNGAARYTAYANLGGPYLVMPFPAGENPYYVDPVLVFSQIYQHETCHVFWALDEYIEAQGVDCHAHSGYLDYVNMNKIESFGPMGDPGGCRELVPCIMQDAKRDLGRPLCRYTRGQMGIIDANNNSVPDVFDSTPDIIFENTDIETVLTSDVVIRAAAISQPVPNNNPIFAGNINKREYAAALKDAVLSVDGTGNLYLLPEDGKWDEPEEQIVFNLTGIPTGLTRVQIKVRTKVGLSSPYFTKRLYNLGLNYSFFTVRVTDAGITFEWNMIGETFGAAFSLYRIEYTGARPDTVLVQADIQPSGPPQDHFLPFFAVDSGVRAGETYHYFVEGTYTIGTNRHFNICSGLIPATAMLSIPAGNLLSAVVPNPFNPATENTVFSIDIPRSYRESGPGDAPAREFDGPSGASALKELVETPVDVVIFDVAGRRIKTIESKRIFSQAVTYRWDGTNQNNDPVPSGIYFLKATAGPRQQVRKIVLMR